MPPTAVATVARWNRGPLRQGIGEGLGEAGEGIDVQRAVEPVHAAGDPPGEAHLPLHPQLPGQGGQTALLRPVAGDDQPQAGTLGIPAAKPRTRVTMSFTGFIRAAMPTTTDFSSTSAPRLRRYSSRSPWGGGGVKSMPL